MVSTYSRRSTAELQRIKSGLLSRVSLNDENADRICAHLDAVEAELQRRTHPMILRIVHGEDEDGEATIDIGHYCPNCDGLVRVGWPFCRICGTAMRAAA